MVDRDCLQRQLSGVDGDTWVNQADELFRAKTGGEIFEKRKQQQFQDATDGVGGGGSLFGALGDKLKSIMRSNTLAPDGQTSGPRVVGGLGFAKVVGNPRFPEHEFFRAGRIFCLRLLHNNLAFEDDARLDGRMACLKLCDQDQGGPLDIVLHTGRQAQFYNSASFALFVEAFRGGSNTLRDWTFAKPANYSGRVENARRSPDSYYDQRYYSHVTYEFQSVDGTRHLARLHLLPADGCLETGRTQTTDQENIWNTTRLASETRPTDYLRREYHSRLQESTLIYRLQIQIHTMTADDNKLLTCESSPYNACVSWDEESCPWMDLAMVSLVLPLSELCLSKTRMTLATCPSTFSPVESQSPQNFRSVSTALKQLHDIVADSRTKDCEVEKSPDDVTKCEVSITTGKFINAGTDGDVYITITGTLGRTAPIYLSHTLQDDFEPGRTDIFPLEFVDVGQFVAVQMSLRSLVPGRHWYLDRVILEETTAQGGRHVFPCYAWLDGARPDILLRKIDAILPHQELSAYGYLQRRYELEARRQLYQWELSDSLPGRVKASGYDSLPREAQFNFQHDLDGMGNYMRTLANTGASTMMSMFDSWDPLADTTKLLTNVLKDKKTVRKVMAAWTSDEEFGRQILNGPHPNRLRRLRKMPDNTAFTSATLDRFTDRGCSFRDEMMAGHVYVLSYPELECLEPSTNDKGKYVTYIACPTCLLYVRRDSSLLPVAIQLQPGDKQTVWTPDDSQSDWLFAKMWVREADAQIHQVMARHLQTHLVMEVFAVSTLRNLPSVHPLYKLLFPHLRYCIAINVLRRRWLQTDDGLMQKLLATGGQHAQLVQRCYKSFHFDDLHLPTDLHERGVTDERCLPGYFYRDDSLALWNVIKKFVRIVLMLHYWTDANVQADNEIHEWITDIHDNGFGGDHGLTDVFSRLDDLIEFVTTIIFTTSCRNAALTFGMMDYYAFCPNMPTMLLVAPPTEKGRTSMDTIRAALPSRGKTAEIISACYTLCRRGKDEMSLGEFDEMHFDSAAMRGAVAAFQEDLRRLQRKITHRNETLDFPYTYLLPENISKTIYA